VTDASAIVFQPGHAYIGVTDLTAAAPYGGTDLGEDEFGLVLYPNRASTIIKALDHGAETIDKLHMGYDWRIETVLLQWDSDTKSLLYPGLADITAGTIQWPGEDAGHAGGNDHLPGHLMSARSIRFLYVPNDTVNNDIVLCHNAIVEIAEDADHEWHPENATVMKADITPVPKNISSGTAYKYRGLYIGPLSGATVDVT